MARSGRQGQRRPAGGIPCAGRTLGAGRRGSTSAGRRRLAEPPRALWRRRCGAMTAEAREVASRDGVTDGTRGLVFELPAKPAAVPAARRALLGCNGELPGSIRGDVLLLVTELVSNAVRHAKPGADRALRVELRRRKRIVRVAVFDGGGG